MFEMATTTFMLQPQSAPSNEDTSISREIQLFDATRCNLERFKLNGTFDKEMFWREMRKVVPVHYAVYLGDCASKKAASANVETVFSGAKKMADDATMMADDLLGAYVSNHINWAYTWLRPSVRDIVCGYLALHGSHEEVSQAELADFPDSLTGECDADAEAASVDAPANAP